MKRKTTIIRIVQFLIMVLILVLFAYLVLNPPFGGHSDSDMLQDGRAVIWNGNQHLPQQAGQYYGGTVIPGFNELTFYADSLTQKVNFYNPQENHCYFKMSLYVEDDLVWKSDLVQPGRGFYEITLNNYLHAGLYDGCLKIECFNLDGGELNSARVHFELTVI